MKALVVSKLADVSVTVDASIVTKRDAAVQTAKSITSITDQWALEDAVECLKSLKSLTSLTERSRTDVKAPVLELGRTIDSKAREFSQPIEVEVTRVNRLVTEYQAEQQRKAQEVERQRQAELRRIEDAQRLAAEEEAKRQREAAEAEAARKQAELDAQSTFDEGDEAKATAAAADAENKRKEAETAAEVERQKLVKLEQDKARAQVQVPAVKVSGLITKDVWKFEVTDLWLLARDNRDLVRLEANTAAINDAIRSGMRLCPGLRIYSETKTEVR